MNNISQPAISALREFAFQIFKSGIVAADPYQAIQRFLQVHNDRLTITTNEPGQIHTGAWRKIHVIAFGKAACPMIKASVDCLPPNLLGRTIAVTNYDNVTPIEGVAVIGASHPLPDKSGFNAAKLCAETARNATEDELVLVLVSGGGSALIPYPVEPVTLPEKIRTTELLLASGANINQVNCVRKHLSQLKGGGLARLAAPAHLHSLILSDVIGDDLSAIASGPTVPDETTFDEAIEILKAKAIWHKVPSSVRRYLEDGQQGKTQETPKHGDACFTHTNHTLIGSNRTSVDTAIKTANELGFEASLYSDNLCGEAGKAARKLVLFAKEQIGKTDKPFAIIAGGETTVTVKGSGKGGRNQEIALAFAIYAQEQKLPCNWVFLSGGTDGRDGPTDAAGAIVDSGTVQRIINAGMNPSVLLANNDSYTALKASADLLITGATGTNVADLQILLIQT